jgi:dipeptidyl aminopeptidase/acylaminoacyl peptidase
LTSSDKKITLEKIMSNPDWIGQLPQGGYWAADSSNVYYQLKRQGSEVKDWYNHQLDSTKGAVVEMKDHHAMGSARAVYSADGKYGAYTFSGDVYLFNTKNGKVTQVTHTAARESSPQFMNDNSLAYGLGDNWFSWDISTKQSRQLVEIKLADEPKGVEAPKSYIAKEQHKLIDFVALEHKNSKDRESYKNKLEQANNHIYDQTFYVGKGNNVVHSNLSPNGRYLLLGLQKDRSWREKGDIMPNYITQDGTIDAQNARRRVADAKEQKQTLMMLDLQLHEQYELSYESLPGWDEDVLAAVKAQNHQREGKTYESKPAARDIGLYGYPSTHWNSDGDQLAVMLGASDNKDRWIAKVDFKAKALKSVNRYHDEAWVNYSYNDFGWFNQSNTLYFLSEQSGFSHLYLLDENNKVSQLTDGKWEVSATTMAADDKHIYFTGNNKHPGIYEAYRVATDSGKIEQLTDLNGRNSYTLSPDGTKLLIEHSEVAMPQQLYVKTIGSSKKAQRLTHTVSDEFLSYNWNTPAIVPVPSTQSDDPIFTKVYYPQNTMQGEKRKAVMFVHGAGYTQNSHMGWAYYFREFMFNSMLTQQGYVVFDMDYRASKGYGRDWRTWIYRNMGTPELHDFKDGVKWMADNANVDPKRVGLYGGSYGGFMTLMSLFNAPDLFQAGAAIRLVSDWAYYNTGYTSNILNTPQVDSIAYERSSPIYFAEGLKNKLLINAPMVDDNVFFQDTVRLVQRLIELEKQDFETAIYPVEPHGFRQASSWLDEYRRIYKLFETSL